MPKSQGSGWAVFVSSCAYAAAGSGAVEGDADALADALFEDFFEGLADALGVGVGDAGVVGAWTHYEDFVTSEVMPFRALSALARLG